ncbi:hypothetical protein A9996_03180 [Gelidibacter algens]|nr:hypothetical protein A9996_03180 [Gelidibacter algens]
MFLKPIFKTKCLPQSTGMIMVFLVPKPRRNWEHSLKIPQLFDLIPKKQKGGNSKNQKTRTFCSGF